MIPIGTACCNENEIINPSFSIDCEFNNGVGWSIFQPYFSKTTQLTATPNEIDGCEEPGCYEDHVTYSQGFHDVIIANILTQNFCVI